MHEKNDPVAAQHFKDNAPPFVDAVTGAIAPYGGRVRVFFMDEARFGRQGTTTGVWAPTGMRPRAVRQT